jgi:hypothetical protein
MIKKMLSFLGDQSSRLLRMAEDAPGSGQDFSMLLAKKNRELQLVRTQWQEFMMVVAQDYLQTIRQAYCSLEMVIGTDAHRISESGKTNLMTVQAMLQRLTRLTNDMVVCVTDQVPEKQ